MIDAIKDGFAGTELKAEMDELQTRKEILARAAGCRGRARPTASSQLAALYREKVTFLAAALQHTDSRSEATEALRGLVDAIVLTPDEHANALQIELRGNLAPCWGPPYKRRGRQKPTTSPCKYLWLRGLATR